MAQIKNIKKPGDLIRGASVGLAGLDKDGNVVGTGINVKDIPTWPEGAQSGDVLAWGGETGPEWRPHYPESGSEGDVLTLGETGPEWTPPASNKKYLHNVTAYDNGNLSYAITFSFVCENRSPFTTSNSLRTFLAEKTQGGFSNLFPCSGTLYFSNFPGRISTAYGIGVTASSFLIYGTEMTMSISDGAITSTYYGGGVLGHSPSSLSNLNDFVMEI